MGEEKQKLTPAEQRDLEKINALERKGRGTAEIARNIKAQIREKNISFETEIGRDFLETIEHQSFSRKFRDEPPPPPPKTFSADAGRKIRAALLWPVAVLLILSLLVLGLWIRLELISREEIRQVREKKEVREAQDMPKMIPVGTDSGNNTEEGPPRKILPEFQELAEENPDMAGWLSIPDTKVDYPVMYLAEDNDFYLSHGFTKEEDRNGLLVLDKRCDPWGDGCHILIHGHNMRSGAVFGELKHYREKAYWEEHPVISYKTLFEERSYEVMAVFVSSVYDEDTADFRFFDYIAMDTEEEFREYVSGAKAQSLYDTGIDAEWGDRLITLSTCEYTKENGRLVIVGREERQEDQER